MQVAVWHFVSAAFVLRSVSKIMRYSLAHYFFLVRFLAGRFLAVLAESRNALAVGAPFVPGFRIFSGFLPAAFCALILRLLAAMLA